MQHEGIVTPPILLVSTQTGRKMVRSVGRWTILFFFVPRPHFVAVSHFERMGNVLPIT